MPVSFFPVRKGSTARDHWATAAIVSLLQCIFDVNDYQNSVATAAVVSLLQCTFDVNDYRNSVVLSGI